MIATVFRFSIVLLLLASCASNQHERVKIVTTACMQRQGSTLFSLMELLADVAEKACPKGIESFTHLDTIECKNLGVSFRFVLVCKQHPEPAGSGR